MTGGELDGKVAVITGAGSGMARAAAHVFVREGAQVLGADISGREQDTADELGDAFVPFRADVSDEASVEAMFQAARDAFGQVDIVLNVAGVGSAGRVSKISIDEYERVMAINLRSVVLGTKHALLTMMPTGRGSILNWSSTGGLNASQMPTAIYSTAKAGVIAITKAAAVEGASKGVRANVICPGYVVTAMTGGEEGLARFPAVVEGAAMKRAGRPEEIAEVASFVSSDRASFMTGAVLVVDGGMTCLLPS